MEIKIELDSSEEEQTIFGPNDRHAKALRDLYGVAFVSRGGFLKIIGEEEAAKEVRNLVHRILEMMRLGKTPSAVDIAAMINDAHERDVRSKTASLFADGGPRLPSHVRPKSEGQGKYIQSISKNEITFGIGPAGTGKTFLAVAMAISALKDGLYRKLVLARPAVEAGEKLGFLPGDFQAKVNPYLRPLYDAIESFLEMERIKKYLESDVIEIVPLAYMRGRTLDRAFIILDEAQNCTTKQMKMFLTRMGNGSKIVITGDVTQIDLPGAMESGLIQVLKILKGIKHLGMVYMDEKDIFRHPMVQRIVKAYERWDKKNKK